MAPMNHDTGIDAHCPKQIEGRHQAAPGHHVVRMYRAAPTGDLQRIPLARSASPIPLYFILVRRARFQVFGIMVTPQHSRKASTRTFWPIERACNRLPKQSAAPRPRKASRMTATVPGTDRRISPHDRGPAGAPLARRSTILGHASGGVVEVGQNAAEPTTPRPFARDHRSRQGIGWTIVTRTAILPRYSRAPHASIRAGGRIRHLLRKINRTAPAADKSDSSETGRSSPQRSGRRPRAARL
jgi:hypothetical protein